MCKIFIPPQTKLFGKFSLVLTRRAIISLLGSQNLDMSRPAYISFLRENPSLFGPIVHYQKSIREKVLGIQFWEKCQEKRKNKIPSNSLLSTFRQINPDIGVIRINSEHSNHSFGQIVHNNNNANNNADSFCSGGSSAGDGLGALTNVGHDNIGHVGNADRRSSVSEVDHYLTQKRMSGIDTNASSGYDAVKAS